MAKLKFTLNKLAKNGFKFIEARENYYTCKLKNDSKLSFRISGDVVCNNAFCYSCKGGDTFFYGIHSVIMSCVGDIIK